MRRAPGLARAGSCPHNERATLAVTAPPPPDAPVPPRRATRWLRAAIPWVSMAVAIASALLMDRGPRGARTVAVGAVAVWGLLLGALVLHRRAGHGAASRLVRGAWRSALMLTQSAIQLALFFAVPLYWLAWAHTGAQLVFLVLLSAVALASLWDPLTERILHHPDLGPVLPAVACSSALNAVLPGFGVSSSASLWIAASATALALPVGLLRARGRPERRRRRVLGTLVMMALLPVSIVLGVGRWIPAAPLSLAHAAIGTRMAGREVADPIDRLERSPRVLVCATAIRAPLGVHERLYHVWRQDGEVRDRIELVIEGGREQGYRTWSRKRNFGDDPRGTWTCAVETGLGQSLGERALVVGVDAGR